MALHGTFKKPEISRSVILAHVVASESHQSFYMVRTIKKLHSDLDFFGNIAFVSRKHGMC